MRTHSFKTKILRAFVVFSALLIATICLTVGLYYRHQDLERYGDLAYSYAETAAAYIDGDKVSGYVASLQKDEYYEQVMDFLNSTLTHTDILYYYVFVPYEDDLVYVWDADEAEGACPLGYREDYMEGGKEASVNAMAGLTAGEFHVTHDPTYGYIGSAYYPIRNAAGEAVALVGVDLSMPDINSGLAYFVAVIVVCVVAAVVIFISILYSIFRQSLIVPINRLNAAAKKMVGNLENEDDMDIEIHTRDEIEELAKAFRQMYGEVKAYIHRLTHITAEKERIEAELDVAKHIQAAMLPCIFPAFPERSEFDIYATMTPAKEVGGDFYDFFLVDDNRLAVVMADVSGKGVPAALFMMISQTLIKSAAQTGLSPKAVLEKVNNQLCVNNEAEMFVTVWLGILEISTGKMACANAGHEYPAVKRRDSGFELFKDKHGFVLAGMRGSRYKEYELQLARGEAIFVYTDGVTEATNAHEELYGTKRALAALNKREKVSCEELLQSVHGDVNQFVGEAPQFDDITMLCLEYRGCGREEP
ncbi:MAG: PP2C family protein-serine/threonine phosphatase [Oscillospiraceae bacterium]|nr:PP2C family protein-serine/threonine phosphatase [Oscillospiraceae bacterium]